MNMENEKSQNPEISQTVSANTKKTGNRDIIWVLIFYAAAVAVHYFIGSFSKIINVVNDEVLYYTMAQSIFKGNGIMCLNAHAAFDKFLYPLVLSPFFGISDPVLRVNMINLFNSALIMSSLVIVYFIGKEINLSRRGMLLSLIITFVWPEFLLSISFMSENLNWPLTLLFIYLWLRSRKSEHKVIYAAVLGVLGYLGYLCKNVFLAAVLTCVLFDLLMPVVQFLLNRRENPRKLRSCFDKRSLIACGVMLLTFIICYAAGGFIFFGSADKTAAGVAVGGLALFNSSYTIFYFFYSAVYLLAASLIAVLILPVLYPLMNFKRLDKPTCSLFSFLLMYLVISCGVISYTVSIGENLGENVPRCNLRYLGCILLLFLPVFFRALELDFKENKGSVKKQLIIMLFVTVSSSMLFKGCVKTQAEIDQSVVRLYEVASEAARKQTGPVGERPFYPMVLLIILIMAVIIAITYYFKRKSNKSAAYIFTFFMGIICFQNVRLGISEYNKVYSANQDEVDEVLTVNRFLDSMDGGKSILYICGSDISKQKTTLITYFNYYDDLCTINDDAFAGFANGNAVNVPESEFVTNIGELDFKYDKRQGFDYIITDKVNALELRNVTRIDDASGENYTLYKNNEPSRVEIVPHAFFGEDMEINFAGENRNCTGYCDLKYTLPKDKEELPWTRTDRVFFNIPVVGDYDAAEISISVAETMGKQSYVIVSGNRILTEGSIDGEGEMTFICPVNDNSLTFDLVCPTAVGSSERTFTGDEDRKAFRLSRVIIGNSGSNS